VVLLGGACGALLLVPTGFSSAGDDRPGREMRVKARVIETDNAGIVQHNLIRTGSQRVVVELLQGRLAGRQITADNHLLGKLELDEFYRPGDTVLVEARVVDGQVAAAVLRGQYRIGAQLLLAGLFGLLLIAVAGWTGVASIVSFFFAALMIWKVLVPALLAGWSPIPLALGVVAGITAAISLLVGGLTRRGVTAFLGGLLGLGLTAGLAMVCTSAFRIHGAVQPFAETLLYSGFPRIPLTEIFIAGVFLAASGAVMDLAMDIASAMAEIKARRPDISTFEHLRSGLRVGRPVIGTMTTTLLLAYSGGYTTMIMLFVSQGAPMSNVLNLNYVAAEVLKTLVGSFGLVTVAPFTALVGAILFRHNRESSRL
jgi:uncharacterized membrane protein